MITQARLKELLYYHLESGDFVWLVCNSNRGAVGNVAGSQHKKYGYILIRINGKSYRAHRLAVFYVTGAWPADEVDHEDTVKHHNHWSNLREATHEQNQHNVGLAKHNTSGIKNIAWRPSRNKWRVRLWVKGKERCFGHFKELSDAIEVCAQALLVFRGNFARV